MLTHSLAFGIGALLLVLGVLAGLARAFLVVVAVTNTSMEPTLVKGDRVLVVRHWPRRWLRRGQIVIVRPGPFPEQGTSPLVMPAPLIKRIAGLPGDIVVTYADQANQYFLEHERPFDKLDLRWTHHIPDQHFFVYGDNPVDRSDSRTWGPVPFPCVLGLVILKPTHSPALEAATILSLSAAADATRQTLLKNHSPESAPAHSNGMVKNPT